MEIIPSVDIRGGNCVSLYQGDYDQETVFSDDPVDVALKWQGMGAPRLHIVDLDGAASGEPGNLAIIEVLAKAILVPIQVGGGIRSLETIKRLLTAGVDRVILGTAAVEDPLLVREACRRYPDSIIVGIDTRDGWMATRGWKQDTKVRGMELAKSMAQLGVKRFIHTDVSRGSTLTEPNFSAIAELINETKLPVIASGGISSLLHIKMLKQFGAEGAIIGKALYTGDINLRKAIDLAN
ncbi:MAG: 1-(5-phosphoribosyl)-5-[(5-phosphoribosylamino)methylideneamino]imidazole-4-carboxamide isomerase [Chloroflexi bacterium]|nr:1-(5-phosphoribosyl)-5-[(5-phosphoribosylamino)methylideneamino]imidazole-4-carboxamide isomerase [Chloroflexota bacterium]